MIGNPMEANFPAGIALAALALSHGGYYSPFEKAELQATAVPSAIVVSMVGHYRGEGLGLVEKI
jgi:3-oxoacyl-[acyl-carrier-protein] synthase II